MTFSKSVITSSHLHTEKERKREREKRGLTAGIAIIRARPRGLNCKVVTERCWSCLTSVRCCIGMATRGGSTSREDHKRTQPRAAEADELCYYEVRSPNMQRWSSCSLTLRSSNVFAIRQRGIVARVFVSGAGLYSRATRGLLTRAKVSTINACPSFRHLFVLWLSHMQPSETSRSSLKTGDTEANICKSSPHSNKQVILSI